MRALESRNPTSLMLLRTDSHFAYNDAVGILNIIGIKYLTERKRKMQRSARIQILDPPEASGFIEQEIWIFH